MPDELKPTLVWRGSSATVRSGVSWLTLGGKDLPTLRLRGKEQLAELCRTLADALDSLTRKGQFRRTVNAGSEELTVLTTTYSQFRINVSNIERADPSRLADFHSLEADITLDLQRWLALVTGEYYASATVDCCGFTDIDTTTSGMSLCLTGKTIRLPLDVEDPDDLVATILHVIGGEPDRCPKKDYLDSINLEKQQARLEFSQQGTGYAVKYRPNANPAGIVTFYYLSSTLAEMAMAIHDRLVLSGKAQAGD